jgi:hypothetical protein
MTTKSVPTVGTKVYVMDTSVSPHVVLPCDQLKGFTPLNGARKKIDKSNMDSAGADENTGGRVAPGESSGEVVFDPTNVNHQALIKLFTAQASGTAKDTQFYVGNSDATAAPTVVAGALVPPQTASPKHWNRTGFLQDCYISKFQIKYADNDVIRADLSLQGSGFPVLSVKGEVIANTYG